MDSDPNDDAGTGPVPLTFNGATGPTASGVPASAIPMSPVDRDLLVRTVLSEGGASPDSMGAVANAIRNRILVGSQGGFADSPSGVVLQKGQFEVWKDGSASRVNPSSAQYDAGGKIVDAVMSGQAPDNTGGATHFFSPSGQVVRAGDGRLPVPTWAKNPTAAVGGNVYFAPNGRVGQSGGAPPDDGSDLSDDAISGMLSGRGGAPSPGTGPAVPGSPPPASPGPAPVTSSSTPAPAARPVGGPTAGAPAPTDADLSDDAIAGMLSGHAPTGNGGEMSDDEISGMLSGSVGATPAAAGTPGALTIHGAGNAGRPSTLTPAAGPFGSLDRGAFGAPPAITPQPADYLPGADRSAAAATPPAATAPTGAGAALDQVEGTGTAAYNTGAPEDGLTPLQRVQGMPALGANMVSEAGKAVPLLGAAVDPLAARLASAITGRSLDDTTATSNALSGQFEADHPWLTGASRLAGGAAAMGPLVEAAPWAFGLQKGGTLAGKMLTSGVTNALLAAGDAELRGEDPTGGGYLGNGLRYGLGVVAPAAGAIAGALTKGGGNALGAVYDRAANLATTQTASGVKGYGSAAVDYLLDKIAADGGINALGAKLSDLGPEGMIADGGPSLRSEAANLATVPGPIKSTIESAVADRHSGQAGRILSDVDSALGPAQSPTPVRQAIEDTAAAVTNPLFARAYAADAPWTPELDALAQRPAIRNALTEAGTAAENRGAPLPTTTLDAAGNPVAATAPLAAFEAGQRPAVTAALADALGVDPTAGPLAIGDRIAAQRSAAADPLYRAYRSMTAVSTSPELAELLSRPSGRAAVALAERKAADQGRSIYVPQPTPEAPPVPAPAGSAEIPDPFEDLGRGPGTLGPAGSSSSADETPTLGGGTPQRPSGPAPTSLVSFLQRAGGVQDAGGDLRSMGLDRFPGLIRDGGLTLDRAREAAAEAGYLGGDTTAAMRNTTPNDLLDAMGNHPTYSVHDEDAVAARRAWADYQASRGGPTPHDLAAEAVRGHLLDNDVPGSSINPKTLDLAAHFHARGMDPGDAWEAAATADPFPGDLPLEPRAAAAGPAEPEAPPPRDITPEGLDYVHRALGDKVAAALRGADPRPDDARIIGGLQDELRDAMENHPDSRVADAYAAARRAYAGPSREIEALDLGRRAYGDNVTREQAARDFTGLRTDGERQQFRQGFFSAAVEKLARKGDGANFVDSLTGNQAFRDKLATVAASPEALGRFGGALDLARQRFTEATRPNTQALHAALDTLDTKVARGADDGVTAARNALVSHLGQNGDFARGRELQGSYNALTSALDDGATALRSGPNALHPDDFAERFAGRTGAGQEAERIAMRNQVDRALGSKPNDLLALRSTLQGEDGWNGRKIGSAFGDDAADALRRTIGREETFGATNGKVVAGAKSAEMLKGSAAREASAGVGRSLKSVTPTGIAAETGRKVLDAGVRALFENSLEPRDLEIAKMIVARGAPRDEVMAQLAKLEARRGEIGDTVNALSGAARTGGNLLLSAGAPHVATAAAGTQAGREADRRMRRAGGYVRGAGNALLPSVIDPPPNALTGTR